MASSLDLVHHSSSDFIKDYSCEVCESKNIEASADFFCKTCTKSFCTKCLYYHDQIYVNHLKYGRGETNKWPLAKTLEDLLLKCDVHNNKKLKMFCKDHSQLCCSDCVLLSHRQCTSLALISASVKKLSLNMRQLHKEIKKILAKLNKFAITQEASIQSLEGSYSQKLQEIREIRKKLNAALDEVENTSLKQLNEIRLTLQSPLKENVDNCSRLKDELQKLGEAVQGLGDNSNREIEFIASMKCLDKMEESKEYLMESPITVQSSIIFEANLEIESLGKVIDSMQSLKLKKNPDQVLTVKRKYEYNVRIPSDTALTCYIIGICSLPSGQIVVVDFNNENVKLFDQHYNVSSHCDVSDAPYDICQITSSEVAVTLGGDGVQFVYVSNGQLANGRKLQLPHKAIGIAHHQGTLFITSWTDLYQYTLTGTLVKKLSRPGGSGTVYRCAVSPAGDRIYVTMNSQHKLLTLTLATDTSLISTFTDPELQEPWGVNVTPAGQVLVCGSHSNTVIQVDREGRKKLVTLATKKDGAIYPVSVCCNTNMHQIIMGRCNNDKIIVLELH